MVTEWIRKLLDVLSTGDSLQIERHTQTEIKEMEIKEIFHENGNNKKVAVLIPDKIDFIFYFFSR